ncbi:MAG: aldehyde dehydrogenase family protein [Thermoleophilaceae bacterium]
MAISPPATGKLESFSPTDGRRLGAVPTIAPEQVQAVVDDVAAVQPFWAALPLAERARYMRRAGQVIIDSLDVLTELLTREQGKPRNESYTMELLPTVDALNWIAKEGPRVLGDEKVKLPIWARQKQARFAFEPLGVVGVIAPWNYPWSIPMGEVAMALMCGNGVVLKPASLTPLIGEKIQEVFERAGVPEGLVRTVHGGGAVGGALVESSAAKIFFTGSVEVGRRVGVQCAERMKGSVLELGGKDPAIVLSDANLSHAVAGIVWGGFANAGQTCSGIERVYVMRDVADRFTEELVRGARALRWGDPMDWDVEIGPMVSEEQHDLVAELVDDAVAGGATLRCGGPVPGPDTVTAGGAAGDDGNGGGPSASGPGKWFAPAVLTEVTHDMRIMREEIFGPVIPVIPVDSEDEAIALANDSDFGLGASVWTGDRERGDRIARRIEAGSVWVNDHLFTHGACSCAWGGVKDSGIGRSHSKFGFYECVRVKQLVHERALARNVWWHPYDAALGKTIHTAAEILYGRDSDKLGALRRGAGPMLKRTARVLRR